MKMTPIIFAACTALLASNIAFAEPKKFPDADTNGDGFVDSTEFASSEVDAKFEEADKNKDGKLDIDEYQEAVGDCA
jgi:Ca2+-binding EF-hand superfamily protein